jgi:hypothetical protein
MNDPVKPVRDERRRERTFRHRLALALSAALVLGTASASLAQGLVASPCPPPDPDAEAWHAFASGYAGSPTATWIGTFDAWLARLRANSAESARSVAR